MKEKIHNWWIRNKKSDWLFAFLLTCLFVVVLLVVAGITIIFSLLCEINIGIAAVALFAFMYFGFLILLKF